MLKVLYLSALLTSHPIKCTDETLYKALVESNWSVEHIDVQAQTRYDIASYAFRTVGKLQATHGTFKEIENGDKGVWNLDRRTDNRYLLILTYDYPRVDDPVTYIIGCPTDQKQIEADVEPGLSDNKMKAKFTATGK
jgi:hypothetical protein